MTPPPFKKISASQNKVLLIAFRLNSKSQVRPCLHCNRIRYFNPYSATYCSCKQLLAKLVFNTKADKIISSCTMINKHRPNLKRPRSATQATISFKHVNKLCRVYKKRRRPLEINHC
jgi:hypothetical protein